MATLRAWLVDSRTSVRLAFLLRLGAMGVSSLLSLAFTPLLLRAMGDALNGLFLSFGAVLRLGGLGDLGASGAISLHASKALAREDDGGGFRRYLASARSLMLLLAAVGGGVVALLSPWLPGWLGFTPIAGAGSLPLLFAAGGLSIFVAIAGGYFHALNYAHGTVTWPILPTLLIGSALAPLAHWGLARLGLPLWMQMLPYIAGTALVAILAQRMLRWSHPWLGECLPLHADTGIWRALAGTSAWVSLATLGNAIYHTTDRLVLNAGFGPAVIPTYHNNYKLCELATTLVLTASFVSLPKITRWLSGEAETDRARAVEETQRLNQFQILLGCGAALGYLVVNDTFVTLWLGREYIAPSLWQMLFAANLAVTTSGDAGTQVATRCGPAGPRHAGIAIGTTGLANLALSLVAMKLGSIPGIAAATLFAQVALGGWLGVITCRHLSIPLGGWLMRSLALPLGVIGLAAALRHFFPPLSVANIAILAGAYGAILFVAMHLAGLSRAAFLREIEILRGMFK